MLRTRLVLAIAFALGLCGIWLSVSPASAAVGHPFQSSLTEASGSPLGEPAAVAVDRSSGRVFVSDVEVGVIDIYGSSDSFLGKFGNGSLDAVGVAVDEASGLAYVADSFENEVFVFKPDGSGSYEQIGVWDGSALASEGFGEVTGVAVDNDPASPSFGDVYVVDAEDEELGVGAVDVFKPKPSGPEEGKEGSLIRMLSKGAMEEPNGIAIDPSSGRVYVADSEKGAVYEYSAAGLYEGKMNGVSSPQGSFYGKEEEEGNVTAIAVDPSSGDLLVAEAERAIVSEFNPSGQWVGWIPSTAQVPLTEPHGVAFDGSGDLYVADAGLARVDRYGPGAAVPDTATEKASKPTRTTTTLNGTVDGLGKPGQYFFQWGTTRDLGSATTPVALSGAQQSVSDTLEGLIAGTTYFFRIVAENENGTSYGIVRELTTDTAVEKLATSTVKNLQPEGATLSGSLAPNGFDAHYYFQWGTSTAYGSTSPEPPGTDAGSEKATVAAETALSGLAPNTTYHYRLVATNSFGTTYGADQNFTTSGPPRITSKPTTGIGHETATLNAEVNPDQIETTYRFEYGESTEYGQEIPEGGADIGKGAIPVSVSAPLTGLKLGVTYHFRVTAENAFKTTTGPDQTFTTIPPALVTSYAGRVSATEATLNATINPLGNDTTYYFQYGTGPCAPNPGACTDTPAPPGEDVGSGEEAISKSLELTELQPDTTYHYRVIAHNSLGETQESEHTLTTQKPQQAFALPDERAWEMVTPPDKGSAAVESLTREGGVILASESGDELTYVVGSALGEAEGNRSPELQQILSTRGVASWSSQDIATPSSKAKGITTGQAPEYQFFTPDFSLALDEPFGTEPAPPLAPGVTQATPYVRDNASKLFMPLISEANTPPGTIFGGRVHFQSATADLKHIVLSSGVALLGSGSSPGLYEWNQGSLALVSVLPGASLAHEPELGLQGRVVHNAISSDGSRVIWMNKEDLGTRGGHLYLRDTVNGKTIQLDAAQGVAEPSKGSALFQGANPDGSRVFFTDRQRLTADSTAETGQGVGKPDLYECEIVQSEGGLTCRLKDLTIDPAEGEHAAVQGLVLGMDEAGSTLYFLAQGVLASNAGTSGQRPAPASDNLYELRYDGTEWSTTFIAGLSATDSPQWEGNSLADPAFLTARVSPSGRYLAFMSAASLTGYDNADVSPEAKGARDEEVYLYDSAAADLRCVSCNPSGARPAGVLDQNESGEGLGLLVDRRQIWQEHWLAGNIPGWTAQSLTGALFQSRYLSNDGRLFFNSPDELVPAAKNHKENVYEYEPSGIGNCESRTGGCISLLNTGTSDRESAFIEATPSGSNAFFLTESNLLPQDTDTAFDIYDARICSAEAPCQTVPPSPVGACEAAETCRPAAPPATAAGGAGGSAAFSGPSNSPAKAAPQTQVKSEQNAKSNSKSLTRKQKLAKALGTCRQRHRHSHKKRTACERLARKRFGPKNAKGAKTASGAGGRKSTAKHHTTGGQRG